MQESLSVFGRSVTGRDRHRLVGQPRSLHRRIRLWLARGRRAPAARTEAPTPSPFQSAGIPQRRLDPPRLAHLLGSHLRRRASALSCRVRAYAHFLP
jgi:hypothetical protein